MTNANLKGKDLFHLSACSQSLREVRAGTHETNLEAIVYTETIEGCTYWLTRFACSACFLRILRTTSPVMALPRGSLSLPHQSPIKKCVTGFPTRHSYKSVFSNEISFPITLACIKLTKKS